MEGISDIRISGIDEQRPPLIRKEPYINLYFKLNHKAPKEWCEQFNDLLRKGQYPIELKLDEGLYIESWVRKIEEIKPMVDHLKQAVTKCTEMYIAKIDADARADAEASSNASVEDSGEQGRLNRVIAELDFDS